MGIHGFVRNAHFDRNIPRILWFDNASKADKAKEWEEQLQQVMAFESVEEFWGLYNKYV